MPSLIITSNNEYVNHTDYVKLVLTFETDADYAASYNMSDVGIKVESWGTLAMGYDLEDALLSPAECDYVLSDAQGLLDELFFGITRRGSLTEKDAFVELYLNDTLKFSGNIRTESLDYDDSGLNIKFNVRPKTDILNRKQVFDNRNIDVRSAYTITAATHNSGVVTVTFSGGTPHGLTTGMRIAISGVSGMTDLNASFTILSAPTKFSLTVPLTTAQTYTSGGTAIPTKILNPFEYDLTQYRNFVDIVKDIYKLINPDVTLDIIHNWKFKGVAYYGTWQDIRLDDIDITELDLALWNLYRDDLYGISNVGDVLRRLAKDFLSFTGILADNKAFFKQLFHYNPDNLQTVVVENRKKGYKYPALDFLKVNCILKDVNGDEVYDPYEPYAQGEFTDHEDMSLTIDILQMFYWQAVGNGWSTVHADGLTRSNYHSFYTDGSMSDFPDEGAVYSNNGSTFEIIANPFPGQDSIRVIAKRVSGSNDPSASGTLTKVSGGGDATITYVQVDSPNGDYQVFQAKDPNVDSGNWLNYGDLIAKAWYNFRGNITNCRVDHFILRGVDYDYLKDFPYDGSKYQPISMKFIYSQNITECEAIYLGELEA